MGSSRAETSATTLPAAVALALAAAAAVSFALGDIVGFWTPAAEAGSTVAWIGGWVLLVWASIVGGVSAVTLVREVAVRRRWVLLDTVFVAAAATVIVAVVAAHPLVGTGSGVG